MFRKILSFVILFIPTTVFAQVTYNLIAPIGTLTGAVNLKQYLDGVFKTTIGIAGILAVLMLVICGIKLMGSGSVSGKSEAKQCIWNAIFGLLLAMGSWILLNTINPLLLKNDAQLSVAAPSTTATPSSTANDPMPTEPGWYFRYKNPSGVIKNSVKIDSSDACIHLKDIQESESPGSVQKTPQGLECFEIQRPSATQSGTETSARNAICGNDSCVSNSNTKVFINRSPCVNGQTKGCTNAAGMPNNAISMLQNLQSTCSCNVTITGGTEGGHGTHGVGIPMLDIRHTPQVDAVIKTDATSKRASFKGYYEWLWNGWWFTDEGDHWHACPVGYGSYSWCKAK